MLLGYPQENFVIIYFIILLGGFNKIASNEQKLNSVMYARSMPQFSCVLDAA